MCEYDRETSLKSLTPQELGQYREYLGRLLQDGRLMEEDAEEAAFNRVINERLP
ncbi:hypothetical protein [Geobacter sp. AOG1]|uniref:hypothetical protein n=1 Tax=Geobacter sp. AOG1 TaxID=1566346 RepID=UPI001CC5D234|nr:hypothetical protein [Geobacter sp. AOG1]GFE58735.1 hypothetical protein AOG1_26150 [Geobacter sp. AOG1]